MEFCVLGPVAVVGDDGVEHVLGATREAALLADLLVHAGQVVSAGRLIEDLWRGEPSPGAAATLQTYVKNLRRLVEPGRATGSAGEVLLTARPGYVLHVQAEGVDAWRAARLVEEGRAALAAGDPGARRDCCGMRRRCGAAPRSVTWPASCICSRRRPAWTSSWLPPPRIGSRPIWPLAVTARSAGNWRALLPSTRTANGCGGNGCWPSTGPVDKPTPCVPTGAYAIYSRRSWGSSPARGCASSTRPSWFTTLTSTSRRCVRRTSTPPICPRS